MGRDVYEDFMQSESWRGQTTRFGYSQSNLSAELMKLSGLLEAEHIEPNHVAEFGCGTGLHLIDIAGSFPAATCWGFEPAGNMYEFATKNAVASGLDNVQILRFALEDIPEFFFEGAFDLTFSILVASFAGDLEEYLKNVYRVSSPKSVVFFLEACAIPGLDEAEARAVNDFMLEIVEANYLPHSFESILDMAKKVGFRKQIYSEPGGRLTIGQAREIHGRKDPRRAEREAAICLRYGLDPAFISSVPLVQQFCLVKG